MVTSLLDSVIIIDHFNGIGAAYDWLKNRDWRNLAVSPITRAEVLAGTGPAREDHIAAWLDSFTCLDITADIADRAARIRREERLRLPDAFQAATAERHGLKLITRNTRDFRKERFPYLEVPYSLN